MQDLVEVGGDRLGIRRTHVRHARGYGEHGERRREMLVGQRRFARIDLVGGTVLEDADTLEFGVDITALSVFTGALGVGLGIGLQKIAANYVAGFILLLERAIRIGNLVQVGADAGTISEITTRYTVIRSGNGVEAIVPNETMISSTVLNQTLTDRRQRLVTSVGVGYGSDVEAALQTLIDCALAQPRVLASPAPAAFLTQFADSSINLELGFWIADPENGKANILSAVNLEIWRRFKAQGIEIPFPQREVRVLSGG